MKGKNNIIKKIMNVILVLFSISFFALFAIGEESGTNKENLLNREITKSAKVKTSLIAEEKKSNENLTPFYLVKSKTKNNKLNLDLSKKNNSLYSASHPNKDNVTNNLNKHLKREFKTQKMEQAFFTTTLVTLAALNIADYLTTNEALKYPGLAEGNPIMKPFVKNSYVFVAVKIGATALTSIYLNKLHKKNKEVAWVISLLSNFALSYVVASNIQSINKVKGR